MSKAVRPSTRGEKQQNIKASTSMVDDPDTPITMGMLTTTLTLEHEKLKKNITDELTVLLTTLLNDLLGPIRSSVEALQVSLAAQNNTIKEMATSLTDHNNRIMQIEQNMSGVLKENAELKRKLDDLESRSKRQNVRVLGLPENSEGKDARAFMTEMLTRLLGDLLSGPPELDRVHRSLQPKPGPERPPRPVIVRFHRYVERETVLRWAKSHRETSYNGHRIKIFEDFSTTVAKNRAAFNPVKGLLYRRGVRFGMLYPARLRVTHNNGEHIFNSPEAAEAFYKQNFPAEEVLTVQ